LTYLLISHDLAAVRYLSSRIGVMYLGKIVEIAETQNLYAEPRHPYTRALLAAVLPPRPNVHDSAVAVTGELPSGPSRPSGCRFHPRCPHVQPICTTVEPTLREVGTGRRVACHFAESI